MRTETLSAETILLEPMKVASQMGIGRDVLSRLKLESMDSFISHQLMIRLSTEVLATKLLDETVSIDWPENVDAVVERCRVARFFRPLANRFPGWLYWSIKWTQPRVMPVTPCGTVHVSADHWHKFPESSTVYPDNLGRPVYVPMLKNAFFESDPCR